MGPGSHNLMVPLLIKFSFYLKQKNNHSKLLFYFGPVHIFTSLLGIFFVRKIFFLHIAAHRSRDHGPWVSQAHKVDSNMVRSIWLFENLIPLSKSHLKYAYPLRISFSSKLHHIKALTATWPTSFICRGATLVSR